MPGSMIGSDENTWAFDGFNVGQSIIMITLRIHKTHQLKRQFNPDRYTCLFHSIVIISAKRVQRHELQMRAPLLGSRRYVKAQ